MTDQEYNALLAEYKRLTNEIADWSKVRNQFIGISLTASAALFSLGFKWGNPFVFLSALLVQLPVIPVCLAERHSILSISAYIQANIEPKISTLNWETSVSRILVDSKWNRIHMLTIGLEGFVIYPIILAFFFAGCFWPWKDDIGVEWNILMLCVYVVIISIGLFLIVYFLIQYSKESTIRQNHISAWQNGTKSKSGNS